MQDAPTRRRDIEDCLELMGFAVRSYPADWTTYGKAAGPIRNKVMLDQGLDIVIAFHPDIEQSKGTRHMVSIARAKGITVEVHNA